MHAVFMAKGPLFKAGQTIKPFDSIELYNLFCHILKIKCNTNDGKWNPSFWNAVLTVPMPDTEPLVSPMICKSESHFLNEKKIIIKVWLSCNSFPQ